MIKKYTPCNQLKSSLVLYGNNLAFCCDNFGEKSGPRFEWAENGAESIKSFLLKRELIFQELNGLRDIDLLRGCIGCPKLKENSDGDIAMPEKISVINNGFGPTFCQSRCIYCFFAGNSVDNNYERAKQAGFAVKLSEIMDYLDGNSLLSDELRLILSSGEITVHPDKDLLLSIASKYPCTWLTNAFVYSSRIAQNLRDYESSHMTVSIDSGTRETYKKVKGRDMFDKVVGNLLKYNKHGALRIKYILIPGINDSVADYEGIILLLKELGHTQLWLSCDLFANQFPYELLESCALLSNMCEENGIGVVESMFSKEERDKINRMEEAGVDLEKYENTYVRQHFRNKKFSYDVFATEYRCFFLQRNLSEKADKYKDLLGSKAAVIWGAGAYGLQMVEFLLRNGIDVYLTDSNKLKHGKIIAGRQVVPFSELADKVDVILLSNGSFYNSVREQVGDGFEIVDFWAVGIDEI